jgi:hypothetical protein
VSKSPAKSGESDLASRYGPAFLRLEFSREDVSKKGDAIDIEPQQIEEFTVTLDINRFLPSFRLKMQDSAGFFTHLVPFDRNLSRLHVQFANSTALGLENTTDFSFDVYRRYPRSDMIYDIEGMLVIDEMFSPTKTRGFSGLISESLEEISAELGCTASEISSSLGYSKNLMQPGWSNARFLNYLKSNIRGNSYEAAFYCFVKCVQTDKVFVFRSVKDFVLQTPKYTFCLAASIFEDRTSGKVYYPILEYRIIDNYKLIGLLGGRRQEYIYFDYTLGVPRYNRFDIDGNANALQDYYSFTNYHLIDTADDVKDNMIMYETGRSSDFSSDFSGRALNSFHRNVTDLVKIWIDTAGIQDVYPGDVVSIEFLEHELVSEKFGFQHQGFWMVEKVVHLMGKGYITRLLLTRNGSDSAGEHNLLQAVKSKKK